ncbi:NifU family protein [Faecalimicrobium sp. JNUCC 81]
MTDKVSAVIERIRPLLQKEGKDLKLVNVNDQGIVLVRLEGNCKKCPVSAATLKLVVENLLTKEIEGINKVIDI